MWGNIQFIQQSANRLIVYRQIYIYILKSPYAVVRRVIDLSLLKSL